MRDVHIHCMTRLDLPIIVVQIMANDERRYLGRVADLTQFERYRRAHGLSHLQLIAETWPASQMEGSTQGIRVQEHEITNSYFEVQIGQTVQVNTGPLARQAVRLVGKIRNQYVRFFFVEHLL